MDGEKKAKSPTEGAAVDRELDVLSQEMPNALNSFMQEFLEMG